MRRAANLGAGTLKAALDQAEVGMSLDDVDKVTAAVFVQTMCRGMKILEVWHDLIVKRFGSVAVNSPALSRLVEHLSTFATP